MLRLYRLRGVRKPNPDAIWRSALTGTIAFREPDAGILARYWGVPMLAYPIALSWILLSLGFMYRAMRALVRKKR